VISFAGLAVLFAGWGAPGSGPVPFQPPHQGAMRLTLEVPATVRVGQPVPVTLRLVNASDRPVEVVLQGRPTAFDVIVSDHSGVVWRRLEGEVVSAILQLRQLGPRDTVAFETVWDQRTGSGAPVPPGEYTIRGELPSDPPTVLRSPSSTLRIDS
jgi:hypothetical protein